MIADFLLAEVRTDQITFRSESQRTKLIFGRSSYNFQYANANALAQNNIRNPHLSQTASDPTHPIVPIPRAKDVLS